MAIGHRLSANESKRLKRQQRSMAVSTAEKNAEALRIRNLRAKKAYSLVEAIGQGIRMLTSACERIASSPMAAFNPPTEDAVVFNRTSATRYELLTNSRNIVYLNEDATNIGNILECRNVTKALMTAGSAELMTAVNDAKNEGKLSLVTSFQQNNEYLTIQLFFSSLVLL